jgi:hypothetical protein
MASAMSLRYQYDIGWLGGGAGWRRKVVTDVTGALS